MGRSGGSFPSSWRHQGSSPRLQTPFTTRGRSRRSFQSPLAVLSFKRRYHQSFFLRTTPCLTPRGRIGWWPHWTRLNGNLLVLHLNRSLVAVVVPLFEGCNWPELSMPSYRRGNVSSIISGTSPVYSMLTLRIAFLGGSLYFPSISSNRTNTIV